MQKQERKPRFRRAEVAPFSLTPRDVEIVAAVARHEVMTSHHLDRIYGAQASQNLRRRLYHLFHDGYLDRPIAQRTHPVLTEQGQPMIYTLSRKGARLLGERQGMEPRFYAADARLPSLHHAVEITDFMLGVELACRSRDELRLISFEDITRRAPATVTGKDLRDHWRVTASWRGTRKVLHPQPDRMFGIQDVTRPEGRNRAFFFLEADRGTMPVVRPRLDQTSILRKLLAYTETHRGKLHEQLFGLPNFRVLFVTSSPARVETMLAAYSEHRHELARPGLFVFTDWATLGRADNVLTAPWRDGIGVSRCLLD